MYDDGSLYKDLVKLSDSIQISHFSIGPFERMWYSQVVDAYTNKLIFNIDERYEFGLPPSPLRVAAGTKDVWIIDNNVNENFLYRYDPYIPQLYEINDESGNQI